MRATGPTAWSLDNSGAPLYTGLDAAVGCSAGASALSTFMRRSLLLRPAWLAFLACAALGAPAQSAAAGESGPPLWPAKSRSRFTSLSMPPAPPQDGAAKESPANARARVLVAEINRELDAAARDERETGAVARRRLAALNALGREADLDPGLREDISYWNLGAGNHETAAALSGLTLDKDPNHRDALNHRAMASYNRRDYPAAIADATRVTQRHPDDERAHTTRALACYASGHYLQALKDARKALAINQNNEAAFYVAHMSRIRIKPIEMSVSREDRALAERVRREYRNALQQQAQLEDAAAASTKAAPIRPDAAARIQRVLAHARRQRYWEAVEEASRAIDADPSDPRALALRAAAYNLVGECQRAMQDATAALALDPTRPEALDARAGAHLCLGHPREALADAERSVAVHPTGVHGYLNRARAREATADPTGAAADYARAASLDPKTADRAFRASNPAPPPPISPVQGNEPRPDRRLWITLFSSLVGGTLVALGFIRWPPLGKRPADARAGLSRYDILGTIGQGGMGVVLEASDKILGRKVALKKMLEETKWDERERERFLQEARIVASLRHPNIVQIHNILEDGNDLFLVFEHVSGKTIDAILRERGALSSTEALSVVRGVCGALEYAHRRGVIHRDLKPSNIMRTEDGTVKVMDFGVARYARESLSGPSRTRTIVGTPQYMAPEAQRGLVCKESDLYALGVCVYEMLAGRRPFLDRPATPAQEAGSIPRLSLLRAGLPPALDALIESSLRADPSRRIASAGLFLVRFEEALAPVRSPTRIESA